MYRAYWNMEYNPFTKEIGTNKLYQTEDFNEAITRLKYLEQTRGIRPFYRNTRFGKNICNKVLFG